MPMSESRKNKAPVAENEFEINFEFEIVPNPCAISGFVCTNETVENNNQNKK